MWSVGTIFAELMLRVPYLAGESDLQQIEIIFHALGSPTEEDWPVRVFPKLSFIGTLAFVMFLGIYEATGLCHGGSLP